MENYKVYLQDKGKEVLLFENENYNKADAFLNQKWYEIKEEQILILRGNNFTSERHAVIGNPLDDWESKRMSYVRVNGKDFERHGDITLIVRGLLKRITIDNKSYVDVA